MTQTTRHLGWLAIGAALALFHCGSQHDAEEDDPVGPHASPDAGVGSFETRPAPRCSEDMRHIVDDQGRVAATCREGTACVDAQCVDVCEAAAKTGGQIGCDYLVPTPFFSPYERQGCFAMILANPWPGPAQVRLSWGAQEFDVTKFARVGELGTDPADWKPLPPEGVPGGKVAVLFLSQDSSLPPYMASGVCPFPAAVYKPYGSGEWPYYNLPVGHGRAFHVRTTLPVTAYDVLPFAGVSNAWGSALPGASLLLPTSAWGTSYVAVIAPRIEPPVPSHDGWKQLNQFGIVVAAEDETTVTIDPMVTDGMVLAPVSTFTLNAGEYLQWQSFSEMSGRQIYADKPVAFVGGQSCFCLECFSPSAGFGSCDATHQMIPPVTGLASEYAVAPYRTRLATGVAESVHYRLVGAANGTRLELDPPIPGVPSAIAAGQTVDFQTTEPFVVRSQDRDHPFYLGQMMTGCMGIEDDPYPGQVGDCPGNSEWTTVPAPATYLNRYTFLTEAAYPTTNLVLVRAKTDGVFSDVVVDCLGAVSGWKPIGTSGQYETTNVDLTRRGIPNGGCANGPHVAESKGRFGVVVWGIGQMASYAYPLGGTERPIEPRFTPPIPK